MTCFICLVWLGCTQDSANQSIAGYLPGENEVAGWSISDTVRTYVGKDLFILINGGAELYHDNDFVQVITQTFENSSGNQISIEIFQMNSADGALKVYETKVSPDGEKIDIGDDAILSNYYMNFRQSRYIVTIVGFDSDTETTDGLLALAKAISAKIK